MQIANINGARAAVVNHRGRTHLLLFNGYAYYRLMDEFGSEFAKLLSGGPDALEYLPQFAAILAEQGELARRKAGYTPGEILSAGEWGDPLLMQPVDLFELRDGCITSLNLGYNREVSEDDEEIDLGLLEVQKKSPIPGPNM